MKVLVACEESQRVCISFREKGHEAYSCDIQECSGGHPEWHIKGDVLQILNGYHDFTTQDGKYNDTVINDNWDLIIAHPPCTYLSNVGAPHLFNKTDHSIKDMQRYRNGLEAKEFFMKFINAECDRICVENPTPMTIWELPKYTQAVQPYFFGEPFKKRTCLWLKGLEPLKPTNIVENAESTTVAGNWYHRGGKDRAKNRSKTFCGIARAMAEQWGDNNVNQSMGER